MVRPQRIREGPQRIGGPQGIREARGRTPEDKRRTTRDKGGKRKDPRG